MPTGPRRVGHSTRTGTALPTQGRGESRAIENKVRRQIIREHLSAPAVCEKMSALLKA